MFKKTATATALLMGMGTGMVAPPAVAATAQPSALTSVEFALAARVYVVGGAGWETVDEPLMRQMLDYRYDEPGNTFVNIEWPGYLGTLGNSVSMASDSLYGQITDPANMAEPQIAIGVSGSTMVINDIMRRLAADQSPDKPTPQDISFVIIGDGERGLIPALVPLTGPELPLVNYTAQPIPVTPYNAIVVKGEYDGLADWPDRPWNLLAVVNAVVGSPAVEGFGEIHWDSIWYNLDDVPAKNITTEVNSAGGTTTTYLVPTAELPLLYPLRGQGVPEPVISVLNTVLKPMVDAGYSRNDVQWSPQHTARARGQQTAGATQTTQPAPVKRAAAVTEKRTATTPAQARGAAADRPTAGR